jgi:hypothetical protein
MSIHYKTRKTMKTYIITSESHFYITAILKVNYLPMQNVIKIRILTT